MLCGLVSPRSNLAGHNRSQNFTFLNWSLQGRGLLILFSSVSNALEALFCTRYEVMTQNQWKNDDMSSRLNIVLMESP